MPSTPWNGVWRGAYIEVAANGEDWRFYRCLRCGKDLTSPNSEDGYGPECKKRRPLDWRAQQRKARKEDRETWRAQTPIPPTAKQLSYLASLAQRKRVPVPQPRSRYHASLLIERLKAVVPS